MVDEAEDLFDDNAVETDRLVGSEDVDEVNVLVDAVADEVDNPADDNAWEADQLVDDDDLTSVDGEVDEVDFDKVDDSVDNFFVFFCVKSKNVNSNKNIDKNKYKNKKFRLGSRSLL